jgi:hypothetical protein
MLGPAVPPWSPLAQRTQDPPDPASWPLINGQRVQGTALIMPGSVLLCA